MKKTKWILLASSSLLFSLAVMLGIWLLQPLPKTLDPAQFSNNPTAYAAYSVAARMPIILKHIPCACPCRAQLQHQSLHDCFRGRHGLDCDACKKEAMFCFQANRNGMSVRQIRKAIEKFEWTNLDMIAFANAYVHEEQGSADRKTHPAQ